MPLESLLVVAVIVAFFVIFAATLAWGQWSAGGMARPAPPRNHREK
jgi:hypothetical protein